MKVSILLPYKENFSPNYAGAVSLFVNDTTNRSIYKKYGGNPHLDNEYTVFGEVVNGMNVVDQISLLRTDGKDRPLKNVYLTVKVF